MIKFITINYLFTIIRFVPNMGNIWNKILFISFAIYYTLCSVMQIEYLVKIWQYTAIIAKS